VDDSCGAHGIEQFGYGHAAHAIRARLRYKATFQSRRLRYGQGRRRPRVRPTSRCVHRLQHTDRLCRITAHSSRDIPPHQQSTFDLAYRECLRIGTELAKLCETKTGFFKKAFKEGCNVTPFQIKLLDSLVRRFVLSLHRPFFAKAKDDPQYHYSRKICLDASLAIFAPATASVAGVGDDWTLMTYRAVGFFKSLILYAMSTIYFEFITQIEEHGKLSNLMAPLVSEATAEQTSKLPPQTQILYDALVRAHHMMLLRLKNGETNSKGVVFFACALARIDALVTGTNAEAKVLESARASVVEMRRIMADVYEQEHGVY
jgi:hypothetical protein